MKNQLTRSIPANSTAVVYEDVKAVVYHYTALNNPHLHCARGFSDRCRYPDFNQGFISEEAKMKAITDWVQRLRLKQAHQQKRRAERSAFVHTLKMGDLLFTSWGYDQTNVDFYEVVEVKSKKSVLLRKLKVTITQDGFMCGKTTPLKGEYTGNAFLKRVAAGNRVKIDDGQNAYPWDGKGKSCSWYA